MTEKPILCRTRTGKKVHLAYAEFTYNNGVKRRVRV